jgi:hypothetical protein
VSIFKRSSSLKLDPLKSEGELYFLWAVLGSGLNALGPLAQVSIYKRLYEMCDKKFDLPAVQRLTASLQVQGYIAYKNARPGRETFRTAFLAGQRGVEADSILLTDKGIDVLRKVMKNNGFELEGLPIRPRGRDFVQNSSKHLQI